jgi:VanZ family protein
MIRLFFSSKPWLRILLSLLYLIVIVLLSLLPSSDLPDVPFFSGEDKYVHFLMYSGLGFLTCWSLDTRGRQMPPLYVLLTGVFLWGVLMEILQRLMSNGRSMEISDMLANLAGAVAGLVVYRIMDRKWKGSEVKVSVRER